MKKLYVLVRTDLSRSQQAVQAGHAVADYLFKRPETKWDNGTLVYLRVRNEKELIAWSNKIDCIGFREPDRGNELTAIACVSEGNEFSRLRLL